MKSAYRMAPHLKGLVFAVIWGGMMLAAPALADVARGFDAYDSGDYATAEANWRPLAEGGDPTAQFLLGLLYNNGQGLAQDNREAAFWYRKAAVQGDPAAQFFLGMLFYGGGGAGQDFGTAHIWVNVAVANGDVEARETLREIEQLMSMKEIAAAKAAARECLSSGYQNCP